MENGIKLFLCDSDFGPLNKKDLKKLYSDSCKNSSLSTPLMMTVERFQMRACVGGGHWTKYNPTTGRRKDETNIRKHLKMEFKE